MKEAIYSRALERHKQGGRVLKALDKAFSPLPVGTNRMLVFYDAMIGTPYGAVDMCMDNVVDCAELPRIGNYIFFGIDIGSFTDAQYKSKLGKTVTETFTDLSKCRPLDQAFYKTSATKKTGHTSIIYDGERILHSGAAENKKLVGYSANTWGKKYWKAGMCVKRFLTDEQYNSVIVQEGGEEDMIRYDPKMAFHAPTKEYQLSLIQLGYKMPKYGADGKFGAETLTAHNAFQASMNLAKTETVDVLTQAAMFMALREDTEMSEFLSRQMQELEETVGKYKAWEKGVKTAVNKEI